MDEDELPLPKLAWDPSTNSFTNHRSRKRTRSTPPPFSSDPALFSSDDDPSADNYTQERRKRKFRGPWYQQVPADEADQKKAKRSFQRQHDSGVFMGSDGTDLDEPFEHTELKLPLLPLRRSRLQAQLQSSQRSAEDAAREEIERCLESGDETIELSSRGLTTLSNATIRPLATFTRISEHGFSQLKPSLKVFLASNDLTNLPEELCKLESLSFLSLRNNVFRELPPAIGHLHNLKELNIANNRLRYLPFEILELFSTVSHLKDLRLHPNPFLELPQDQLDDESSQPESDEQHTSSRSQHGVKHASLTSRIFAPYEWNPEWTATYKSRTDVRYLESNGTFVKGPDFSSSDDSDSESGSSMLLEAVDSIPVPPEPRGNYNSRAPSLLEVALKTCSQSPQLPNLASFLHEECPEYLFSLMANLEAKKESGGSKCTICKRTFFMPRTEWIEWWDIAKTVGTASASPSKPGNQRDAVERIIPLMRRGCSWLCVPKSGDTGVSDQMALD
ncbi:hypothetical protein HYALB_00001441 [Hymenoscyphus albidus]|uniref:Uncharacterized protein n=1 Tax=Hymenoscyphus albidus TaxID=595503 RepID=A0A9N9LDM6_9HELO|nr:hypothetical protein HYALB_00001441 [Hymenoscyphus albidus]